MFFQSFLSLMRQQREDPFQLFPVSTEKRMSSRSGLLVVLAIQNKKKAKMIFLALVLSFEDVLTWLYLGLGLGLEVKESDLTKK